MEMLLGTKKLPTDTVENVRKLRYIIHGLPIGTHEGLNAHRSGEDQALSCWGAAELLQEGEKIGRVIGIDHIA
jgi:hypothetical protein